MKTLNFNEDCPKRGRRLRQLIRAVRRAGFECLVFADYTTIKVPPYKLIRTRKPKNEVIEQIENTHIKTPIYSILLSNDNEFHFVRTITRLESKPVWKLADEVQMILPSIASYYEEKGYTISIINDKQKSLKQLCHRIS